MKILVTIFVLLGSALLAAQDFPDLYQQALNQERGVGNLELAIQFFERAAKQAGEDRVLAANALLGAARCYEKLGSIHAQAKYAEVARTYADQANQAATATGRAQALAQTPLGFNFEAGPLGGLPYAWGVSTAAEFLLPKDQQYEIVTVDQGCLRTVPRCLRMTGTAQVAALKNTHGGVAKSINNNNVKPYLGKRVRFRVAIRTDGADTYAQLTLRIDRFAGGSSVLNNLQDLHIVSDQWNYYTVDGPVGMDSIRINVMMDIRGSGRVWLADPNLSFTDTNERKP